MAQTDDWTREQKLLSLMLLPWTVTTERDEDGSWIARVGEIRDAIATGANEREMGIDLWESLQASLAVRLDRGDPVPLPAGSALPWLAQPTPDHVPNPGAMTLVYYGKTPKVMGARQAVPAVASRDYGKLQLVA